MKVVQKTVFRCLFLKFLMAFLFFSFNSNGQPRYQIKIDSLPDGKFVEMPVWLYHAGDLPEYAVPDYPDDDWDTISSRLDITNKGQDLFPGIAWFRIHLEIDSSLFDVVTSLTMIQVGASQIFHNGKLIKSFGKIGTEFVPEITENPKDVPIILNFGNATRHVIAVKYSNKEAFARMKNYNATLAGFRMNVSTYETALGALSNQIGYSNMILALFLIFVVLGGLHLLLYFFLKEKKANLFYSLFVFGFSIMLFWTYAVNSFLVGPIVSIKLGYLISLMFPWVLVPLVRMLYHLFFDKTPRMFWVIIALSCFLPVWYFFKGAFMEVFLAIFTILVFFEVIRVTGIAVLRKKSGIWIIGTGVIIFIVFFAVIALIILMHGNLVINGESFWGTFLVLSILFSVLSIPLSMSVFLARDFAQTNKNLKIQFENVKVLSAKTIEQEKEKQRILEGQKERLEVMVTERTRELAEEKEKTEQLLLNTLPLKVVNDLKMNGKTEPESFDEVTVYFSDIVGFTNISTSLEPAVLIGQLNDIFTAFDNIMERHHCERIKTIGDAYLAVCGMPERHENHAENMAKAALEIRQFLEERNQQNSIQWKIRIGLHSGKVVGGVVGIKKYIYDVFGDTINTTSRMESNSEPMRINVSETTYRLLQSKFRFTPREPMEIKGKGLMRMYFLEY